MKYFASIAAIFCFLFGFSILSNAATITVPGDYPTIQAALDACNPGDIVEVADGTYTGQITWPATDNVTLRGSSGNRSNCIIDAADLYGIYCNQPSLTLAIHDLTIQNASEHRFAGFGLKGDRIITVEESQQ